MIEALQPAEREARELAGCEGRAVCPAAADIRLPAPCTCPKGTSYCANPPAGHVYLLAHPAGSIKIGKTTMPTQWRAEALARAIGCQLEQLHAIQSLDCGRFEAAVHRTLRHFRDRQMPGREWFKLPSIVLAALRLTDHVCWPVDGAVDDRGCITNPVVFLGILHAATQLAAPTPARPARKQAQLPERLMLLTADEAAERLKVPPAAVADLLKSGEMRGYRIGNAWRTRAEFLEEWLATVATGPARAEASL